MTIPVISGFDYSALDTETADKIKRATDLIKGRGDRIGRDIIAIGMDLLSVKARLKHGLFEDWLHAELRWDIRTVQRCMAAAKTLGEKSDSVSYLPPTTIYLLSEKSTPPVVREDVLRRLDAGEQLHPHVIKSLVKDGKRTKAEADHRRGRREAHKLFLARQNNPKVQKREERQRLKNERMQRERDAVRKQAAKLIRECVAKDKRLPELLALLEKADVYWRLADDLRNVAPEDDGAAA